MRPEEVKVGQTHFIHPFRKVPFAGAKVVIEKRFGVDFMVRIVHNDCLFMLFYSDLLITS
jgi:hypothetical protein